MQRPWRAKSLVACSESFGTAGERPDDSGAADTNADIHQRVQEVVQDRVDHRLAESPLVARQREAGPVIPCGWSIARHWEDCALPERSRLLATLIGVSGLRPCPVHVKLAAREPAEVARVGSIEEQQRPLTIRSPSSSVICPGPPSIRTFEASLLHNIGRNSGSSSSNRILWDRPASPASLTL